MSIRRLDLHKPLKQRHPIAMPRAPRQSHARARLQPPPISLKSTPLPSLFGPKAKKVEVYTTSERAQRSTHGRQAIRDGGGGVPRSGGPRSRARCRRRRPAEAATPATTTAVSTSASAIPAHNGWGDGYHHKRYHNYNYDYNHHNHHKHHYHHNHHTITAGGEPGLGDAPSVPPGRQPPVISTARGFPGRWIFVRAAPAPQGFLAGGDKRPHKGFANEWGLLSSPPPDIPGLGPGRPQPIPTQRAPQRSSISPDIKAEAPPTRPGPIRVVVKRTPRPLETPPGRRQA